MLGGCLPTGNPNDDPSLLVVTRFIAMSTYPFQAEIEHPDRRIDMERVHNFRDLGGYPTSDGRVTKWRTLFRSDGLHRLRGDSDIRIVQSLNLKSVIDLRTKREQREQGIFPLETIDVDFHHV